LGISETTLGENKYDDVSLQDYLRKLIRPSPPLINPTLEKEGNASHVIYLSRYKCIAAN
jgi:hypothetical protein